MTVSSPAMTGNSMTTGSDRPTIGNDRLSASKEASSAITNQLAITISYALLSVYDQQGLQASTGYLLLTGNLLSYIDFNY